MNHLQRGDVVTGKKAGTNGDTWTVINVERNRVRVRFDATGVTSFIRRDELEKNWKRKPVRWVA